MSAIVNATIYYVGEVIPNLVPNPTELNIDPVTGEVDVLPMPTTGGNVPGTYVEIQPTVGMIPQDATADTIYVDNADLFEVRARDAGTNINASTLKITRASLPGLGGANLFATDSHNVTYEIGVRPDDLTGNGNVVIHGGWQAGRPIIITGQVDPAGLLVEVNNVTKHIPLV